jgi:hypothetical protein
MQQLATSGELNHVNTWLRRFVSNSPWDSVCFVVAVFVCQKLG